MSNQLSDKAERFPEEFIIDLNATKAAQRSGYSKKTAYSQGQRLLKNVEIQRRIQELKDKRSERTEITADQTLKEIAALAFSRIDDFAYVDEDGLISFKAGSEIPKNKLAAISSIQRITFTNKQGEETVKIKFTMWDKPKSLEMLCKHLGIFEADNKQKGVNLNLTEKIVLELHEITKAERLKTLNGEKNRLKEYLPG